MFVFFTLAAGTGVVTFGLGIGWGMGVLSGVFGVVNWPLALD